MNLQAALGNYPPAGLYAPRRNSYMLAVPWLPNSSVQPRTRDFEHAASGERYFYTSRVDGSALGLRLRRICDDRRWNTRTRSTQTGGFREDPYATSYCKSLELGLHGLCLDLHNHPVVSKLRRSKIQRVLNERLRTFPFMHTRQPSGP